MRTNSPACAARQNHILVRPLFSSVVSDNPLTPSCEYSS